jgi:hypothetical protein
MPKYILIVTAILVVLLGLFAALAPSGFLGMNDFQIGQVAGRATGYIIVFGILAWIVAKVLTKKK